MSDAIVKNLSFGSEARKNVFQGITKLTKAVSSTLGAGGKCVLLEDSTGKPVITKDGVTVADSVTLLDPVENMGATLLKEAARKTVKEAGDGTTTATVLAHSILIEAQKQNVSARTLKEGIDSAVTKVIASLEKSSVKVTGSMIDQVATISTNNDPVLGKIIADAFRAVGENGVVVMETTAEPETEIEIVDGVEYDKGLTNSHFVTSKTTKAAELENPLVLIVESPVESIRKIQGVLEFVIKINIINAPTYGVNKKDTLDDLALLTGATVINEDLGDDMDLITPEHLGQCLKSITTDTDTILTIERNKPEVIELIDEVKALIKNAKAPGEIVRLERRLARLSAMVAIIKVGANSSIELKEKADRVEDAICATKAAIKEGIVPGGGIALLNASTLLKPNNEGEEVLLEAIKAPYKTILKNAGLPEVFPSSKGKGINVVTGKDVNMIKSGILDPLLVTKSALRNAASVATTILSTDCVINNLRIDEGNR